MKKLTIATSSAALFDLEHSDRVYKQEGLEAYSKYQLAREHEPLSPGSAFSLIKKLLNLNTLLENPNRVEVVLLSRNTSDTGLRVFKSIEHHNLSITRAAFTGGTKPHRYMSPFGVDLFLSTERADVVEALEDGKAAASAGIRFVHQDLGLVDTFNAVENISMGVGYTKRFGGAIDWKADRKRAQEGLESLGFPDIDVNIPVGLLAPSQKTAVAIARALHDWDKGASLLVLDEPTASLPGADVERLFAAVRRLQDQGVAILYVSHHLDEVFEIADTATVLRDGKRVATLPIDELDHDKIIELMIGKNIEKRQQLTKDFVESDKGLKVRGLTGGTLAGVDLHVEPGEIVGIAGIGVVTYRSVSERSQQIGMLRALGFKKSTVLRTMITEISWISLLGLLNGALVALAFHIALHTTFWEEQGAELILPWFEVIAVVLGGWILVLFATFVPVRKATQITPSEALSSPD